MHHEPGGTKGIAVKGVAEWVARLGLVPHPEGGYYREVYRSDELIPPAGLPDRFPGPRPLATSIYYLLPGKEISAFHRLRSDEIWNFYHGSPLVIAVIRSRLEMTEIRLGADVAAGEVLQAVVPAGRWFGAFVLEPASFSVVGCTLAPGFDFADFELGRRDELLDLFPRHRSTILKLTR
jgi:predicted cupin superfamily sugar epimerase